MFTRSSSCLVPFTLYTMVRGFSAAVGGAAASGGTTVGAATAGGAMGAALGVVTVVTVSGGNWVGRGAALGGTDAFVVAGAEVTGCGAGAPTVAVVDALSPLLMITAVAMAPRATTAPNTAVAGRQRESASQPVQL